MFNDKLRLGRVGRIGAVLTMSGAAAATALAMTPGTFGGFAAGSSNPGNSVSAGTVQMTNSVGDRSALTLSNDSDPGYGATNLAPGHSVSGSVTITNSGSLPAAVTLSVDNVKFENASGTTVDCATDTSGLCNDYTVTITDGTEGATTGNVFSGNLADWQSPAAVNSSAGAATWAAKTGADTFTVTVTLNGGTSGAGDEAQGSSASFDLDWSSASV